MANHRLSGPRVSALSTIELLGAGGTNDSCHGNTDGVDPNDKAILAHVRIMVICWGRFYKDHPDAVSNAFALCHDLVTGRYFNGLAQYGVGRGSMAGVRTIDDTNPPQMLDEDGVCTRIKVFVLSSILDNTFPKPSVDEKSLLYVVFLPPQTKPTISSGADDFCGYHSWSKFNDRSQDDDLFYAVIRTDKAPQSTGQAFIQSVSYCVSHEIAEAVTSRDGRGYNNGSCEIGDLCEQNGTFKYQGWDVEQYWSVWRRSCIQGDRPVSLRRFLATLGQLRNLRLLGTPVVNIEFIASLFR
jgi:hypothetical protein